MPGMPMPLVQEIDVGTVEAVVKDFYLPVSLLIFC